MMPLWDLVGHCPTPLLFPIIYELTCLFGKDSGLYGFRFSFPSVGLIAAQG